MLDQFNISLCTFLQKGIRKQLTLIYSIEDKENKLKEDIRTLKKQLLICFIDRRIGEPISKIGFGETISTYSSTS